MTESSRNAAASERRSPMTHLAIVVTDPRQPDNPITYVNDGFQAMTLYSREFALGRNCRFLQGEETSKSDVSAVRRGIEKREEFETVLLNYKADGTPFLNQLLISPVFDDKGELVQFFGVQRHLATGEEALQMHEEDQVDRDMTAMLRELQHRVKNHLSMIVGMIRIQSRREITKASFASLSRRIEALALLYEELLSTSAVSGGETISAGAYLSRIATVISSLEGRSSIRVNVQCDQVKLPVDTAARLGLLLSELLTNALEHAFTEREQGSVSVRLEDRGDKHVALVVEDDGSGLPENSNWPYSAESVKTRTREAKETDGTLDTTGHDGKPGVGGSIVASLAQSLEAEIKVDSSDRGTRVEVLV